MNPNHKTVTLKFPTHDHPTEIDEDLADLITACWDANIFTSECCQEAAPGMAHIGFGSLMDMEMFYYCVRCDEPDDSIFDAWKWELWADGGLIGGVYFPRTCIDWAAERIRQHADELVDVQSPGQQ